MVGDLRIEVEPDPDVWFLGPTEHRPVDVWLPEAHELLLRIFEVDPQRTEVADYLTAMLGRIGHQSTDDEALPYQLIRWLTLHEVPDVVSFGLVERDGQQSLIEDFLTGGNQPNVVEEPVVDEVDGSDGRIRRALTYADDGVLMIALRYVVDTGEPDAVVLVETAGRDLNTIVGLIDPLDDFARSVRLTRVD